MHDDPAQVTDRVQRFLAERLRPAIIRDAVPCDIAIFEVAGEPVPAAEALAASYSAVSPGYAWGPPWGTAWLRVRGHLPRDWPPESGSTACRALGTAPVRAGHETKPEVRVSSNNNGPNDPECIVLDNDLLRVVIDPDGQGRRRPQRRPRGAPVRGARRTGQGHRDAGRGRHRGGRDRPARTARPARTVMVTADGKFAVELRPFQIRTLVLRLGRSGQPLTPPETTRTK